MTRDKELGPVYSSFAAVSSVLETGGVQLLLIQRALRGPHGPTAGQTGISISHRLFMSKVRRTQNGLPQLSRRNTGIAMSKRVIGQPAGKLMDQRGEQSRGGGMERIVRAIILLLLLLMQC